VGYSTGCCLPTRRWRVDRCWKERTRRAGPLRSSLRTSASPWGPARCKRLRDEESHYRNINQAHRRHFGALDVPLGSVGVAGSTRSQVREGLAPYDSAVDLPIVRLLAEESATSLRSAAIAAAP
jgi:hypothetical protein